MISNMQVSSNWFVLFKGSGSAIGNSWVEKVRYLGEERWLLSLNDDPAWSLSEAVDQEPEERSSTNLADWVIDMDSTDEDETYPRVTELLEIAIKVGASKCVVILREFLQERTDSS